MIKIEKYKIFCFDFDGVIVESSILKSEAYRELFEKYFPEKMPEIMDYHLKNSGLVRYKKIRYICEEIAGLKNADTLIKQMINEYESDIFRKVVECPFVHEVIAYLDFLYNAGKIIFVVSGTPDDELEKIIQTRGLKKYFADVYGGSESKEFWLKKIMKDTNAYSSELIFFGDGVNDYEAAEKCNIDFVFRLTGENDYLKNQINFLQLIENYNILLI